MGSCRHNLGAHNSVHFMMGLSCAYVAHNLCTIWHRFPSRAGVHTDCTHLQQHNRAFTMVLNKPYPSVSSHLKIYAEHAAPKELVFILCSRHTLRENFRVHSEFCIPLPGQQYSHKQLVRLRKNHLLGWYSQNFILWACANHIQFIALLHSQNI